MNIKDEQGVKWLLQKVYESGYRYMAMDKCKQIFLYGEQPIKREHSWGSVSVKYDAIPGYLQQVFAQLVTWGDEEPFDIGKYLGIVDWANVPVDTKVLVSNDGEEWERKYFKCYDKLIRVNNEEHPYVCFVAGCTSWSNGAKYSEAGWKYCKLAEDE